MKTLLKDDPKDKNKNGVTGHRSPYLVDANDTLYQMSYDPLLCFKLKSFFYFKGMKDVKA